MFYAMNILLLIVTITGTNAVGTLHVLHNPESISFTGENVVKDNFIKEIYSAAMGFSTSDSANWEGLILTDPFELPEAVVEIYVDGITNFGNLGDKTYPVIGDGLGTDTFEALKERLTQRHEDGRLVNIRCYDTFDMLRHSDVFGDLPTPTVQKQMYNYLSLSNAEDFQFLTELENLKAVVTGLKSNTLSSDSTPDFFTFRFNSLLRLTLTYGQQAAAVSEAKKLLSNAIEQISDGFQRAYDGSVLVCVVTNDQQPLRRVIRAAEEFTTRSPELYSVTHVTSGLPSVDEIDVGFPEDSAELSLDAAAAKQKSADGNPDYPVIFTIISAIWILFFIITLAIIYTFMSMDPGRDSIIYRMTTTRLKKDN